jgi:hypothetical protein
VASNVNQVRVKDTTYGTLRTESLKYQLELKRQVSMGELISAALAVAAKHPGEISKILAGDQ